MRGHPPYITELAEAVADGIVPDWASAEGSSTDPRDRRVIASLRAVQAIHGLMTTRRPEPPDRAGRVALPRGSRWGGLEIREHVGRGRFGDVYRAWDPALDRDVALKLVRQPIDAGDGETRVVEEGRMMARVRHPNVVTIHGAQRLAGVSGIWMEFIEGRTLTAELAERGPFAAPDLVQVGSQLALALESVHRAGLVHRDVKTQNVLRHRSGHVVLGDFGTGRELQQADSAREGVVGTPAYLAPEIFEGKPATRQSDIYSLGALLFHLATGRHPVPGRSLREVRDNHARGTRLALPSLRPDLPGALRRAIERALEPRPSSRFESGAALAAALEKAIVPAARRARAVVVAACVVLTAMVVALVSNVATTRPGSAPPSSVEPRHVLVTGFQNDTGEPLLDHTLTLALARELSTLPSVQAVPQARVQETLSLMRRPPDTRIDASTGPEVAARIGRVSALVSGRVEKQGDLYRVSAVVRRPSDGVVLATLEEASIAYGAVVEAVGRLAMQVRERVADMRSPSVADAAAPLHRVTTSSLRALRLYAEVRRVEGSDEEPSLARLHDFERLLREAIVEDPDFADAYRMLALVVRVEGERRGESRLPEALAFADEAAARAPLVSPVERLRNEGARLFMRMLMNPPDPEASITARALLANCETRQQLYADDIDALVMCVDVHEFLRTPNPLAAARRAELRPGLASAQVAAARHILMAAPEDVDRARPFLLRAARLPPSGAAAASSVADARLFAAHEAWLLDRPRQALAIAEELSSEMSRLPADAAEAFATSLWPVYVELGQLDRAEYIVRRFRRPVNRKNSLAIIAEFREDSEHIRAVLAEEFTRIEDGGGVSSAYLDARMLPESRRLIEAHRRMAARRPPDFSPYVLMLEGNLALLEDRPDDAVQKLREFLKNHGSRQQDGRWRRVNLLLADALTAQGKFAEATAVLESASSRSLGIMGLGRNGQPEWLQIRERLAVRYRAAGRIAEADAVESQLRTLLAFADDDHPIKRRLSEMPSVAP